jgi:hypothetical protein
LRDRSDEPADELPDELLLIEEVDWGEFGVRLAALRFLVREFDSADVDSSF